jgi:hypothetical protein
VEKASPGNVLGNSEKEVGKLRRTAVVFLMMIFAAGFAQGATHQTVLLWPNGAPRAKGNQPEDQPTLTIFLPDPSKAVHTGVVVCPGGTWP